MLIGLCRKFFLLQVIWEWFIKLSIKYYTGIELSGNSNSDGYTSANFKNYFLNITEFISSWSDRRPNNNNQLWM